jgi:hypothetical protein
MAQDVIQRKNSQSELESINGYFVGLAEKVGVYAPYNKAIYELCRREFARPSFHPLDYCRLEEIERNSLSRFFIGVQVRSYMEALVATSLLPEDW